MVKSAKLYIFTSMAGLECKRVKVYQKYSVQSIINELRALGNKVDDEDFSPKFFRCLPYSCEHHCERTSPSLKYLRKF